MNNPSETPRATTQAYPLVLTNLAQVRCVIIGGGTVAERKVGDLLESGAYPHLISPTLTPTLASWRDAGRLHHNARVYHADDLQGAFLVFAATDEPTVNAAVAAEGRRRGLLINRADNAADGNFHTVAAVRRGDLLLTVSTGGTCPTLAARIRHELQAHYGAEFAPFLAFLRELRDGSARALSPAQQKTLWQRLSAPAILRELRKNQMAQIKEYALAHIATLFAQPSFDHDVQPNDQ